MTETAGTYLDDHITGHLQENIVTAIPSALVRLQKPTDKVGSSSVLSDLYSRSSSSEFWLGFQLAYWFSWHSV